MQKVKMEDIYELVRVTASSEAPWYCTIKIEDLKFDKCVKSKKIKILFKKYLNSHGKEVSRYYYKIAKKLNVTPIEI